jgi:hypothetical protein
LNREISVNEAVGLLVHTEPLLPLLLLLLLLLLVLLSLYYPS